MHVIGTAGHVDHGKSTLIQRLTGINPDRLKAEQDREMSIELGFAWFTLPNGEEVGIVDVPGHRDFIENMLAGIGGIEAVLLVIAADEGVMPQTREHLAILDLLQIPAGLVVLTKTDLVDDPEWLDLIEADVRDTLSGTVLQNAPILRVSARTGDGLEELSLALQALLTDQPHHPDLHRPRLPVDRVFTLPGFGTIVTGTLRDGSLSVGDAIEIQPEGVSGRVRGLQTHKQAEPVASPGSRTAVNISGVSVDQIKRGSVILHPDTVKPTRMIDVWCRLLEDEGDSLKHNTDIKLFLGTAEVMARVRVLGVKALQPGEEGFLQLILQTPIVAQRQDRFIIRRPSPAATIGGGRVLDAAPARRHKRFNADRLRELEQLLVGTPTEILLQTVEKLRAASAKEIMQQSGLEQQSAQLAIAQLQETGELLSLTSKSLLVTARFAQQARETILSALQAFHQTFPLRMGMPRESLKSESKLSADLFDALIAQMAAEALLVVYGAKVRLAEHTVQYTPAQKTRIQELLSQFTAQPYAPPSVKEASEAVGDELLNTLIENNQLIQLNQEVLFQQPIFEEMQSFVIEQIQSKGGVTLAELRDQFNTSRKYAVAVLEYLDEIGITVRKGETRHLRRPR